MSDIKRQILKLRRSAKMAKKKACKAKQEFLDRELLDLASEQFEKVKASLKEKKVRFRKEKDALSHQVGESILEKARKIRENFIPEGFMEASKKTRRKIAITIASKKKQGKRKTKKKGFKKIKSKKVRQTLAKK